jgi:hypothetical protein
MSVYVDPMVNYGKRIGRAGPMWCHMIADTLDELHALAQRIGLRRSWFQNHGRTPHYDIGTERVRALAIVHGALDCVRRAPAAHSRSARLTSIPLLSYTILREP